MKFSPLNVSRKRNVLLALALAIPLALSVTGCDSHAAPDAQMPAPEVSVAEVLVRKIQPTDAFTGRVAAVETVALRPRVSGYVDKVVYDEGQDVAKGDL